jgi:hypothetical protein
LYMSLLSTPTARPERVFSLISLVRALGGRVNAADAREWLVPQHTSSDAASPGTDSRGAKAGERVRETFRVARDLNLLDADKDDWLAARDLPATRKQFAGHVHAHLRDLRADDPDAVLLRAYAWSVAYVEVNGPYALISKTSGDLAAEIAAGLGRTSEDDEERSFNTTKLSAWKDWMSFLGLGWNDLPGTSGFLPDPSRRLEEELSTLIPSASRIDGKSFMAVVAKALPYLDGGALFDETFTKGFTTPPRGQLSRLLSHALRALEENALIRCEIEGDAKHAIALFPDPVSGTGAFSHIQRLPVSDHV